jgi:Tfp pilus assembly protein PilX/cytoskeletal protein CcmA (bactofilin family)
MLDMRISRLRDEDGSALLSVLIVMLVLGIVGLTLAAIVVNTQGLVVDSRARTEARATADAGLAATVASLKRGDIACPTAPSKLTVSNVAVSADAGSPTYSYAVSCTATEAKVRVNADVRGAKTAVQADYAFATSTAQGGDMVFFGTSEITLNSNVEVTDPGRKVSIVIPQATAFNCNATIPGNLTVKGSINTQSGCNVSGNVAAGGTLNMCCGSDTFKGELTLRGTGSSTIRGTVNGSIQANGGLEFGWENKVIGGSVTTTGDVQLGSVRIQGTLTFPSDRTYTQNSGIVVGNVIRPTTVAPVPPLSLPTWFEYKYKVSDWPGYNVVTLVNSGSGAGTCSYFNASPGTGWTTWLASFAAATVVDARACTNLTSENGSVPVVQLKHNLVILANAFDLGSITFRAAAAAAGKPSLYIVTEDRTATDNNPTCGTGQGTIKINGTVIESSVRAIGYTPCKVDVGSKGIDQWSGTLYGGSWTPGGKFTFSADPIGLPGMGAEHGVSVETKSVGALVRQRDVTFESLGTWTP